MLKTYVGPVESEDNIAYLRPETAQAIFVQFKNVLEVSRQKVPFGICQIGKAFRNEINPRNFTFRSREFEQMELEFFIRPDEVVQKMAGAVASLADPQPSTRNPQPNWGWELWHKYWVEQRMQLYESIGLGRDTLVEYWQKKEELAHYARASRGHPVQVPFGTQELEGIAARGDFDLTQHQKFSGKSMEYFDEEAKAKYVPHVIEPSAGVDRLALALICNAYCEDQAPDEKGKMEIARGDEVPSAHRADQSGGVPAAQEQARAGEEGQGGARPACVRTCLCSTTKRARLAGATGARTRPARRSA